MKKVLLALIVGAFVIGSMSIVIAGDGEKGSYKGSDKGSMKGSDHDHLMETKKADMQAAMVEHIHSNSVNDVFELKDPQTGETRRLSYIDLHKGIGMKNEKHFSCADFKDLDSGAILDVDIYVDVVGNGFQVVDAVIHKVDGEKVKPKMKGSDHGGGMKGSDHDHDHSHKGSTKGSGY